MKLKDEKLSKSDWMLINKLKWHPRIVGYMNKLLYFNPIRKYKGKYRLEITIAPEMLKLPQIGFHDKWSRNRYCSEQFTIELTERQIKELKSSLQELKTK